MRTTAIEREIDQLRKEGCEDVTAMFTIGRVLQQQRELVRLVHRWRENFSAGCAADLEAVLELSEAEPEEEDDEDEASLTLAPLAQARAMATAPIEAVVEAASE